MTNSMPPRFRRILAGAKRVLLWVAVLYLLPVFVACSAHWFKAPQAHWSRADRSSVGIAPDPVATKEAVVQVYAARTYGWRGILGLHTWIALKPTGAAAYERMEVVGWGVRRGRPAVRIEEGIPDSRWYGNDPYLLSDLRGERAESVIPKLRAAASSYPYPDRYVVWPGPNSNTFVAHVVRRVPELGVDLPSTAIGKNYPVDGVLSTPPGGPGLQISLGGIIGVAVGIEEGIEVDLFGLIAGIDFNRPALRLPGIGRLGMQ